LSVAPPIDRFQGLGLSREAASSFIGVSGGTFDAMVKAGTMPPPRRVGARKLWDRREIEAAFAALPRDGEAAANPWDVGSAA
jgi:predicted DNA-binding transcriptional regulator AlpA